MDLYVSSIPFKWKDREMIEVFEAYGEVTAGKIIIDKITRQNKGFGFITMASDDDARMAIAALNGSEQLGRNIIVSESKPKHNDSNKRTASSHRDKPSSHGNSENQPFWKRNKRPK